MLAKLCPNCGGRLVFRSGPYGEFLGCSNFPKCHHTERVGIGRRRPNRPPDFALRDGFVWENLLYDSWGFPVEDMPDDRDVELSEALAEKGPLDFSGGVIP